MNLICANEWLSCPEVWYRLVPPSPKLFGYYSASSWTLINDDISLKDECDSDSIFMYFICASVFTSEDIPSAWNAFLDAANDWQFVSFCTCLYYSRNYLEIIMYSIRITIRF